MRPPVDYGRAGARPSQLRRRTGQYRPPDWHRVKNADAPLQTAVSTQPRFSHSRRDGGAPYCRDKRICSRLRCSPPANAVGVSKSVCYFAFAQLSWLSVWRAAVPLGKFRRKYGGALHAPIALHPRDLKTEDGILHLPLYMTPLIVEIPS